MVNALIVYCCRVLLMMMHLGGLLNSHELELLASWRHQRAQWEYEASRAFEFDYAKVDLFSLYVVFFQYTLCNNTIENCFVQISFY